MSYYPASAPQLPYPWSSHYDSNYDALYFTNSETGESRWTHPFESAQDVQGNFNSNAYNADPSYPSSSYQSGSQAPATGAASSFYGSEAPVQTSQYNSPYPDQAQGPPDANGEPGERGLGKVVAGGAVLYMGYKMLKKYQNKQSHSGYPQMGQSYGAAPQYGQGMQGGMMGAGGLGSLLGGFSNFGKRDMEPAPHQTPGYGPPATAPPIFGDAPYQSYQSSPYSDNSYQQSGQYGSPYPQKQPMYGQQDSYNSNSYNTNPPYQQPYDQSYQNAPSGGSKWGDPRY